MDLARNFFLDLFVFLFYCSCAGSHQHVIQVALLEAAVTVHQTMVYIFASREVKCTSQCKMYNYIVFMRGDLFLQLPLGDIKKQLKSLHHRGDALC